MGRKRPLLLAAAASAAMERELKPIKREEGNGFGEIFFQSDKGRKSKKKPFISIRREKKHK